MTAFVLFPATRWGCLLRGRFDHWKDKTACKRRMKGFTSHMLAIFKCVKCDHARITKNNNNKKRTFNYRTNSSLTQWFKISDFFGLLFKTRFWWEQVHISLSGWALISPTLRLNFRELHFHVCDYLTISHSSQRGQRASSTWCRNWLTHPEGTTLSDWPVQPRVSGCDSQGQAGLTPSLFSFWSWSDFLNISHLKQAPRFFKACAISCWSF